ncbi:CAP domain-containing protein [Brevibacillus fulvus]|uniref:YkwD family protein n=1 Tax=Brevibacillus fulvus TaxID=1125967 RepID=A0A939BVV3_9BACL|nr:CAP domain-containing protein [Brevibacillus fulvus]MBM7591106.1 putative YkwD family protein [Brevibacillus fulvus]
MKKNSMKKSLAALTLTLVVASLSTSAFAATYKVQANDTLFKIAQKKSLSLNSLIAANPQLTDVNRIYPGMRLNLPAKVYSTPAKQQQQSQQPQQQQTQQQTASVSAFASQVADLVNQERAKAGLKPLQMDSQLSAMATDKAKDMANNHYFDHNSPTYGSPFEMMEQYGINYSYAGENIAMGQRSPQQVMEDWMNSSGHRANILNANYTKIGVAYYNGYWVQEFTKSR